MMEISPLNSVPSPPHNPTVSEPPPTIDTGDRGFFEEDDSAQRVWSIYDKNSGGGGGGSSPGQRPTQRPAQRPQTTTTAKPNSIDANSFDNNSGEFELEYPPEAFNGE